MVSGFLGIFLIFALGALIIQQRKKSVITLSIISLSLISMSLCTLFLVCPKIISADSLRSSYSTFTGSIGILGELTVQDDGEMMFLIKQCKNHSKPLPVIYTGVKQPSGAKVIAYGKLNKNEAGEYHFGANKIIADSDDLTGKLVYLARTQLESSRRWIFEQCPKCVRWKKVLFS